MYNMYSVLLCIYNNNNNKYYMMQYYCVHIIMYIIKLHSSKFTPKNIHQISHSTYMYVMGIELRFVLEIK